MRFLAERTQFRRDRVVVPIARKHLLPDPLFFRCIFSGRRLRRCPPATASLSGVARCWHSNAYFSLFSSLFFFDPPNRFVQIAGPGAIGTGEGPACAAKI